MRTREERVWLAGFALVRGLSVGVLVLTAHSAGVALRAWALVAIFLLVLLWSTPKPPSVSKMRRTPFAEADEKVLLLGLASLALVLAQPLLEAFGVLDRPDWGLRWFLLLSVLGLALAQNLKRRLAILDTVSFAGGAAAITQWFVPHLDVLAG
jgi:hypothetical protein